MDWITKSITFDFDITDVGKSKLDKIKKLLDPIRQKGLFIYERREILFTQGEATIKDEIKDEK